MKIYHYDPDTKIYLGSGQANLSPLEPGVFAIPAHATEIAPPVAPDGQAAVWTGPDWQLKPDHRGQVVYRKADTAAVEITEVGEIPAEFTDQQPPVARGIWNEELQGWQVAPPTAAELRTQLGDLLQQKLAAAELGEDTAELEAAITEIKSKIKGPAF